MKNIKIDSVIISISAVAALATCVLLAAVDSPSRSEVVSSHAEVTYEAGHEVRLKATGQKGVVVRPVGSKYLVRYAEHDGRLSAIVMDGVELLDWPSSYQVAKPEAK